MSHLPGLTVAERLYGLSFIWQEANYNFAYFDRVPDLDWDAAYREFVPRVIAAEDTGTYYDLLARFTALLKDGHTVVVPPKSLFLNRDRPKLMLMNVGNAPVVTNASQGIGQRVPIGSELLEVDGVSAQEYLATRVIPLVCETTPHRRLDHAVARMLLGPQVNPVTCRFRTPDGRAVTLELPRNRRTDVDPWLHPPSVPDPWEFMYFDEWLFAMEQDRAPFTAFQFRTLEGNLAYVALNTFMNPTVVTSFEEKLPVIRRCAGMILDLRKNHGGQDDYAYRIVSHFLRQPAERLLVRTRKNIASRLAAGAAMKHTPPDQMADLAEWQRESLLCYRMQWFEEMDWGQVQPASERLECPTVILTSSETGSAAEDFLMAFESGRGETLRIGAGTAGSSGQPLMEVLPGGGMLGICTVRMPWPEEIRLKGIEPHIHIEPTVEDVILGHDRILQAAIRHLCG